MKPPRYCAILGERDSFGERRHVIGRVLREPDMQPTFEARDLVVLSNSEAPLRLAEDGGVILGAIHSASGRMEDMTAPDLGQTRTILQSRGAHLISCFWGDYVAFLRGASGPVAIRAPFGGLDCLHIEHRGLTILASDLAMLRTCTELSFELDWPMIANHLATGGLRQEQSCVAGVSELLGGMRLVSSDGKSHTEGCWNPWQFAAKEHLQADASLAAETLRECIISCIAARARHYDRVLLMLSGGLDSSIIAVSLAAAQVPLDCLTLTSGDTVSDERHFARQVAETIGASLHEAAHAIEHVDFNISQSAGMPRPLARAFAQASRLRSQQITQMVGAQAVFDGAGGDNLFCYLQSVTPVADRLRIEGPGPGSWATACDMAQLADTNVFTILRGAARRAWFRGAAWRWPVDWRFLSQDALACTGRPTHRWLNAPSGALPGAAAHIALLVVVENLLETGGSVFEQAPLVSQPIAELCLSIASWLWCEDGHNRAVARRAFASMLPPEIAWRRSKGSPDHFVSALYDANRGVLSQLLADGLLASQGLVDRDAVVAALARQGPIKGHDHAILLRIADVEAWARSL